MMNERLGDASPRSPASATAPRQLEIPEQFALMRNNLESFERAINSLEEKIHPILSEPAIATNKAVGAPIEQLRTPFGSTVNELNNWIARLHDQVRSLWERAQL